MDPIIRRVAVVDDAEPVRLGVARLLRSTGVAVATYGSGPAFLDSLAAGYPDCVVLDLSMPGMHGFEVLSRIAARDRHVPVVVLTAHDDPGVRERALRAGASSFLLKPVEDSDLLAAIAAAIAGL